jgi:hypothetical protein
MTAESTGNCLRWKEAKNDNSPHDKGEKMAEPQETRQEQETRWAAQRATRDKELRAGQAVRKRQTARTWLIVGAIVILVALIVVVVLL